MKSIFTCCLALIVSISGAQTPILEWVKGLDSQFENRITDGDLDNHDNILLKGFFKTRLDFDPGPDSFNLTTQGIGDGYALGLDSNGIFKWAKQFSSENENGRSALDMYDSIAYVTGHDFGKRVLETSYILNGNDTIIHYINSGTNIEVDHDGNIIVCGEFINKLDFDPSSDTLFLDPIGNGDAFVAKLTNKGKLIWVKQIGGTGYVSGNSIHVDHENNLLITGQFLKKLDMDPSQPGYELITDGNWNSFIVKYNTNGDILWYKLIGGAGMSLIRDVVFDEHNNAILGGNFSTVIDFKDVINPSIFQSVGEDDIFLANLDPDGQFNWIQVLGGPESQYLEDIAVDKVGNIFTVGEFYGEVDFDPGNDQQLISSAGYTDIFIQVYEADGAYHHTWHIPGPDAEYGGNLLFDNNHNMVLLGQYGKSVDFDLSATTSFYSSLGSSDTFIAKYSICNSEDTLIEISNCDSISVNNEIYFSTGQYLQHLTTWLGCDSILQLSITINHRKDSLINAEICQGEQFEGYSETGTYQDTFQSSNGCDSVRTLILQVLQESDPSCTGTSTQTTQMSLSVLYPNPTNGFVYINDLNLNYAAVQIVSPQGMVINEATLRDKNVLDFTEYSAGLYLIRFLGPQKSIVFRVVKQ